MSGEGGALTAESGGDHDQQLPAGSVRLRFDLAYDGTAFSGWAEQPGRRTAAGELSTALATLFRVRVPLVVAGRTDAGVHATGQVAHVDVSRERLLGLARRASSDELGSVDPVDRGVFGLLRRLAGLLPPDLRVRRITLAPDGFDARFSALRRHYRYRIATTTYGTDPLRRFDTLAWPRPLRLTEMQEAAALMLGLHDFASYCKPPHPGASTIRTLERLTVRPVDGESDVLAVDASADAFCHSMVRSLVGALLAVGDGRFAADRPAALLTARLRTSAISAAPAHGLTLVQVDYPSDRELRARTLLTRAVRTASAAGLIPPG